MRMGRLSLFLLLLSALLAALVTSAAGERGAHRSESEALRRARAFAAGFAQFRADERAGRVPPRKPRAKVEPEIEHEATLGLLETLAYRGYPGERHSVRTQDGYVLTLFRVPHGRAGPGGTPVLLALCSSIFNTCVCACTHLYNTCVRVCVRVRRSGQAASGVPAARPPGPGVHVGEQPAASEPRGAPLLM